MDEKNKNNEMPETPDVNEGKPAMTVTEEQTETVVEPATEETVAEPTEETVAEPATEETVAEPTTEETVAEPTEETVAEPTTEEAVAEPTEETVVEQPQEIAQERIADSTSEQPAYNMYGDLLADAPVEIQSSMPVKKKKGLKIALISAACVVVAAIVVGIILLVTRKTPEEAVKLAVVNTFSEVKDSDFSIYEGILGLSEFDMNDIDVEMTYTIDEVMGMEGLNGAEIALNLSSETDTEGVSEFLLETATTIAGNTLTGNLYYVDEIMYLELPEICDSVFTMDMGEIQDLVDPDNLETTENNEVKELYNTYMLPAKEELEEAITYEKVDTVKITNQNEDVIKTTQYKVVIPSEAVKAYLTAECDYLSKYAQDYLTDEDFEEMDMTREGFEQLMTMLPNWYSYLFARDFEFNLYVHDDKLARVEFSYRFSLIGATMDVTADFMGDEFVLSDVYANCDITIDNKVVNMTAVCKQTGDSKELTKNASFTVAYEDALMLDYQYLENYDIDSEAYSKTATMDLANLASYSFEMLGSIHDIERGKTFYVTIDSFTLSDATTDYLRCSGSLAVGNLDKAITKPDNTNTININELTDEDILNAIDLDKLEDILDTWGKAIELDDLSSDSSALDNSLLKSEDELYYGSEIEEFDYSEYNDILLESEKYLIDINEPEDYARFFADESEIDMLNDVFSVYYTLEENVDIEEKCSEFLAYYDYFEDSCEIKSTELETVTLSDGTSVECYIISVVLYNSDITDMFFFYPLEENDYIICNIESWESDADIQSAAEKLLNKEVIIIQ